VAKTPTSPVEDNPEEFSFEDLAGVPIEETPRATATVVDEEIESVYDSIAPMYQFEAPEFEAGDMAMPKIRLGQMQTPEVVDQLAKPGQFIVKGYPALDEIVIFPQAVAKTRELRNEDGEFLGRSPDGIRCCINPRTKCAVCPNAQWDRSDPKASKPPKCQEVWRYIVVSPEHDILAELVLQKTAIPTAGFINLQLKMKGPGKFALLLGSTREQSKNRGGGFYYVPKATLYPVSPNELDRARKMAVPTHEPALPASTEALEDAA
jgi:hypothetical protein